MPTTRRPSPVEQRAAREARRLQATEPLAQGHTHAEVARTLGVPGRPAALQPFQISRVSQHPAIG